MAIVFPIMDRKSTQVAAKMDFPLLAADPEQPMRSGRPWPVRKGMDRQSQQKLRECRQEFKEIGSKVARIKDNLDKAFSQLDMLEHLMTGGAKPSQEMISSTMQAYSAAKATAEQKFPEIFKKFEKFLKKCDDDDKGGPGFITGQDLAKIGQIKLLKATWEKVQNAPNNFRIDPQIAKKPAREQADYIEKAKQVLTILIGIVAGAAVFAF